MDNQYIYIQCFRHQLIMVSKKLELQKDWDWVRLGDYVNSVKGKKPKRVSSVQTAECPLPYINIKAFEKNIIDEYTDGVGCALCEDGDFLMVWDGSRSGYVGKAIKGAIGSTLVKLDFPDIENNYAYYFLQSKYVEINTRAKGVGIPHVDPNILWNYDLLIPPKPTQQATVSKIEELFSELDKGVENLRTAQQQLIVYKKTILFEGVTGKLTEEWRTENLETPTSDEVFNEIQKQIDEYLKNANQEAVVKGKRKPKDQRTNKRTNNVESNLPVLPSLWKYFRLEDITYLVTDGTHFTPKYKETGIKFLSVKNVRPFYFREENLKYISEEEHQKLIERCNPQKGDILYTKVGATFGYAAKITMDYEFSIFVSLCLIKPVYEFFSSEFLEILMNSELVFQQARKRVSGSGVPDLHLIEIRDFKIPLPCLKEQIEIVKEIESRLSVADKMEESITQSLQQAEGLRQSILKKAFEGNLC